MRRLWAVIAVVASLMLGVPAAYADEATVSLDCVSTGSAVTMAAAQTTYAWGAAEEVVLVPADGGALLMDAVSLAGALHCPVMYVSATPEPEVVAAIQDLGVKNAYLVASKSYDARALVDALSPLGLSTQAGTLTLIQGADDPETSIFVVRYGDERGLWSLGEMYYACCTDTAAALACAPYLYTHCYPVLLTGVDGRLTAEERSWLKASGRLERVGGVTTLGSLGFVSREVDSFSALASGHERYMLSRHIEGDMATLAAVTDVAYPVTPGVEMLADSSEASWPMTRLFAMKMGADLVDVAGESVYDTAYDLLDEGATRIVITTEGDPLDSSDRARLTAIVDRINRAESSQVYFSGSDITYWDAGIGLADMAKREVGISAAPDGSSPKAEEIEDYMDPTLTPIGTSGSCQFLDLSQGYSGLVTAEQLDAFIESYIPAIEAATGYTSPFHGKGETIIKAARAAGINEVYILAHAIVECGAGCSYISTLGGYYNFFGIAAYDSDPEASGSFAAGKGWSEADDAIIGGAAWISEHYINSSAYHQNTLYLMRWRLTSANHQYCTSCTFPVKVGQMIERIYAFAGVDVTDAGFSYSVPVYS